MSEEIMFTEDNKKKIDETHDAVIQIKTVLLGTNGDLGLCGEFKDLKASHYRLKRNCVLVFGVLAGSGILTGSILAAINLV